MTEPLVSFETARLAKQKGFDEECMNYFEWYELSGKMFGPKEKAKKPIDFREWAVPLGQTMKWPLMYNLTFWPVKNSTMEPWFYARPSLDLLETWLDLKHGIHVYAKIVLGEAKFDLPPLYVGGLYTTKYMETAQQLKDDKTFNRRELARDAACLMALKLLPDAA